MLSLSLALKYHPPHCVDQLSSIPPSKILATSCGIARIQNTEIPLGELKNTESKMTRVFLKTKRIEREKKHAALDQLWVEIRLCFVIFTLARNS